MSSRLVDVALASYWGMTEDGLAALIELYGRATDMTFRIESDSEYPSFEGKESSEVGQHLHLRRQGSDQEYIVSKGSRLPGTKYTTIHENGVAVIDLIGPIFPRANMMTEMSGATNISAFTKDFVMAYNDPAVRGIVLDVDSPGGVVTKIGDSAKIIYTLAQSGRKPVAAFATGYMASAAYYIGSAVGKGRVFGSEMSEIGSIGVLLSLSKKDDTVNIVSSKSPMKRPDHNTEEGHAALQQRVDDLLEIFGRDVAKHRGVSVEKVFEDFGKGDVAIGGRAKSMGLIDKVSTIGEVVSMVAREATNSPKGNKVSAEAVALLSYTDEEINEMGLKDLVAGLMTTKSSSVASGQSDEGHTEATEEQGSAEAQTIIVQSLTDRTREQLEEEFSPTAALVTENLVLSGKLTPAERPSALCDLVTARIDDAMFGGEDTMFVNADGELVTGTREEAAMARYENRNAHSLTKPAISAVQQKGQNLKATILGDSEDDTSSDANEDAGLTPERREKLLRASAGGQSVLNSSAK